MEYYMIHVHHLEKSRSHRILWLLELLELAYEIHVYQRDPKTQQAPEALKSGSSTLGVEFAP
ncbi:hypothetical protein [Halomonas sp.]|uniref:hypothetical protein n=1 Tax=Halomonas sp. TaxID=1486246 RepID=UPI003A90EFE7